MEKKKVEIYRIIKFTPGGLHAWVESNVGIIKKEVKNIKIFKMANPLDKFQPIDIIAIFTLIGGLTLRGFGIDGLVGTILITIVVFYFGKKEIIDKIRNRKLPEAKSETVEETIKRIAKEEGVDPALAVRVAKCESGLNPAAKHVNPQGSIDRGLFQWNNCWHPEITDEVAYDVEKSTRAFCKAFKEGHLDWWNASKNCWNR